MTLLDEARAATLTDYIRSLLRDGKRRKHDDFQFLFKMYGEKKIIELAEKLLEEMKEKEK